MLNILHLHIFATLFVALTTLSSRQRTEYLAKLRENLLVNVGVDYQHNELHWKGV